MDNFTNRLKDVANYYQHGDLDLGFRRLVDSVLDTGNTLILKEVISFTDWRYKHPDDTSGETEKALELIQKMEKFDLKLNSHSTEKIIDATNISKRYAKGNFTLGPLNVSIQPREVVGLVGENGNGKTTLLRLLSGELRPSSGQINYQFKDKSKSQFDLRTQLVYIPQRIELLRGGLMDNLQFTLTSYGIKGEDNYYLAQTMLARMGLWPYKDLSWSRLSSGYKMRFELARTLLRKPEVLLLDEPLANLDILAQQIILEDLRYLSGSLLRPFGVVLSSQQLYEVEKVSDKIIYLENGRLVSDSSQTKTESEDNHLILELDSSSSRDELQLQLQKIGLVKMNYNGGNYILYFPKEKSINDVMTVLGTENISVTYLRDISNSSRRFFLN